MEAKKQNANTKLLRLADKIKDNELRKKVKEVLEDPTVIIGGIRFDGLPLETSPASKNRHHSYPKGLVQHTVNVVAISISLSNIVEKIYRTPVNRDVVLASALLHDVMKPLTYTQEDENYGTSSLGERLDHLSLAVAELIRRGFPLEIVHTVASHHGRGGPIGPRTIEALICSLADGTDASLNGKALEAAEYLIFDCLGEASVKLSAEEAFHVIRAKQDKGWAGVVAEYKKIHSRRFKKA